MARYTCSYIVDISLEDSQTSMQEIIKSCNFELVYNNSDYLMAKENPGNVPFTKLVIIEGFIDTVGFQQEGLRLSFVVKNDELPLQIDNHCHQIFDFLQMVIAENYQWQAAENVIS